MKKKIYFVAGELSGDTHGAKLIEEIKAKNSDIEYFGLGGPKMNSLSSHIRTDLTKISALGFTDVLKNYFSYRKIFYSAIREIKSTKPDLIILIDFPGFNLRLSKKLNNFSPIFYYITPQLWAWGKRRIYILKKFVKQLFVLFPFEKTFYEEYNIPVTYVGHPMTDKIKLPIPQEEIKEIKDKYSLSDNPIIGILPGSREKEVKRILPPLLEGAQLLKQEIPNAQFILSQTSHIKKELYDHILNKHGLGLNIHFLKDQHYDVIKASDVLAVCSGTATFETALHEKPFFLVYKTSFLTYLIGRILIQIPFLGIVNILSKKKVISELIQYDCTAEKIKTEMALLISDEVLKKEQIKSFAQIRDELSLGDSAKRIAEDTTNFLLNQTKTPDLSKNT